MLDGNLRQQQTATAVPTDEKAVPAHFNRFGLERLRRGENAELNFEARGVFFGNGWKAVVLKSRGPCRFCYRTVDRATGQHVADASPQFTAQIKRSEDTAVLGKMRSGYIQRDLAVLECERN